MDDAEWFESLDESTKALYTLVSYVIAAHLGVQPADVHNDEEGYAREEIVALVKEAGEGANVDTVVDEIVDQTNTLLSGLNSPERVHRDWIQAMFTIVGDV